MGNQGKRREQKRKRREQRKRRAARPAVARPSASSGVIFTEPYMGADGSMKFSAFIPADLPEAERERISKDLRDMAAKDGLTHEEHGLVTLTPERR
jgi:hypothetical protein